MPTYIYRCRECGHQHEHIEKITSRRKTRRCPVCGGRGERLISGGAGFLFKGEGFYITDYRSEEYRKKAKAESEGDAAPKSETAAGESRSDGGDKPDKAADKPTPEKKRGGGAKKKKR